jgi:hypothetical protein
MLHTPENFIWRKIRLSILAKEFNIVSNAGKVLGLVRIVR